MNKLLLCSTVVVSLPAVAFSQPVASVEEKVPERTHSINISPLGALVGDYALTYEHLFADQHGLIVEGIGTRSSGDEGKSLQFGGGVGYRWHWRARQNSGFLGLMVAQRFGSGEVTVNGMTHDMSVRSTTVTANIGKRWMLTDAVNVTLRLGAGWGHHVATAKEDTMAAKDAEETMNGLLSLLPIGLDGELSVGYTF
jgi:hypothetical protein